MSTPSTHPPLGSESAGDDYTVMRGNEIRVGDVVLTSHHEWTVTGISDPIPWDTLGMFRLFVTPERHKPIHTYPESTWRVRRAVA